MTRDRTAFALFGTTATEPAPRLLRAGGLTAEFANGNLRAIRFEGTEILRAIAFLVRDRDWGTCDLALSAVDINETENGFSLTYAGTCEGPGGSRLQVAAEIHGEPSGRLSFNAKASSSTGFETNRCGFCILHPVVGLAGEPARIEYVDGRIEDTRFPDLIEPWQPFREMRAITHRVMPGVTAECRMEGDTFEMEDQRNWSDASFKTYVRPLALPWPYRIEPDEPAEQRIRLSVRDERKAARPSLHPG
ncbi:MAG: D-apionate lactonase, partial [Alphaproteobacteria bacterium]